MVWLDLQRWMLRRMDAMAARVGWGTRLPQHLEVGLRGEREAMLELRRLGYVVVARRWKTAKLRGDVDLIAWDGESLCFVEVKTRTVRDAMDPAESAVDEDKRTMLRRLARSYLRGFPEKSRGKVRARFDVVSVYLQRTGTEYELYRGAFGWE
jgi:putative endonuclease